MDHDIYGKYASFRHTYTVHRTSDRMDSTSYVHNIAAVGKIPPRHQLIHINQSTLKYGDMDMENNLAGYMRRNGDMGTSKHVSDRIQQPTLTLLS